MNKEKLIEILSTNRLDPFPFLVEYAESRDKEFSYKQFMDLNNIQQNPHYMAMGGVTLDMLIGNILDEYKVKYGVMSIEKDGKVIKFM